MKKAIILLVILVLNFINLYNIGKNAEAEKNNLNKENLVDNIIGVVDNFEKEPVEEVIEVINEKVDDKIVESVEKSVEKEPVTVEKKVEVKETNSISNQKIQEKKVENTTIKNETSKEQLTEEKHTNSNNNNLSETTDKQENEIVKEKIETEEKYTEIEVNVAEKKECTGNNHGIGVGNSGQWFNTKDEAVATYRAEIKEWEDKWNAKVNPISDDDYYSNCPCGYEVWTCMYCGKWTLNYYYY